MTPLIACYNILIIFADDHAKIASVLSTKIEKKKLLQITLFAETKVPEQFHRPNVFPRLHPWARLQSRSAQSSGHDQKDGTEDIRRPCEIGTGELLNYYYITFPAAA